MTMSKTLKELWGFCRFAVQICLLLVLAPRCITANSEVGCSQSPQVEYGKRTELHFWDDHGFTNTTKLAIMVYFLPDQVTVTGTVSDMNDNKILLCTWINGTLQPDTASSDYMCGGLQNGMFSLIIKSAMPEKSGIYRVNLFSDHVIRCMFTYQDPPQLPNSGKDLNGRSDGMPAKVAAGVLAVVCVILIGVVIFCCCKQKKKCDRPCCANARDGEAGLNNLPPTEGESWPAHEDASTTPAGSEPVPMDEAGVHLMNGLHSSGAV